ncbi:hypothetical protein KW531_00500 [Vibrio fluvialis]|nr:hypothetical protein [Vibrio fluvialis]
MNKKALIIDHGYHFKQIYHCAHLWSKYDISTVVPNKLGADLNCHLIKRVYRAPVKGFSLFLSIYIFLLSFKYDKFIFLTGPEYGSGIIAKINRLFFLVFCCFFKKNIIVYVKNTHSYQSSKLLQIASKYVRFLLFESDHQRDFFASELDCDIKKCKTAYVYYPDFCYGLDNEKNAINIAESNERLRVGIIGQFDTARRDYMPLISILNNKELSDIEFYQIGRVVDSSVDLKKQIEDRVVFIKDDYNSEEIDYLVSKMDVLLSMNSTQANYDSGKGTAAFCEAIAAKRTLIVPRFLDVYKEFSSFVYYYNSQDELREILLNPKSYFKSSGFSKFNTNEINVRELF